MNTSELTHIDQQILSNLGSVSTATIAMQLYKRGFRRCYLNGVKPLHNGTNSFVGPAFTLRNIPMREDIDDLGVLGNPDYPQRKAIETTPTGCCLVSDSCGNLTAGVLGDILAERLRVRGVAGLVTDGAVRDSSDLETINLPIYCATRAAPASLSGLYAVELQVPIGCAGVAIFPGDIMAGDKDGVVVIPRSLAKEVATNAPEQERYEQFVRMEVTNGRSTVGLYPATDKSLSDYKKWNKDLL